ncbi:MAG: GNAT family N-acetyltransferase [Bacteroidales bacterium]|nr:GNAT family N-acetyltransferase [Bacteroidales bacterium]
MMLTLISDRARIFFLYRLLGKKPDIYREYNGIIYRYFSPSDSLEELTDLINKAFSVHKEKGLNYMGASQDSETTIKRIRKSYCIIALLDEKIVGTLTIKPPWRTKGSPWFNRRDVCKSNQFAVDPDLQSKGIGSQLMQTGEYLAAVTGAKELACDTSEHAKEVIDYHLKRGFRFIEYVNWKTTNYRSVVMSKKVAN